MRVESILTPSRWSILKEVAKRNNSATEIAKKLGTSIANISQQIKLLEAYNFLKERRKEKQNKSPGKPKTEYEIGSELIQITYLRKDMAGRKTVMLKEKDAYFKTIVNILFLPKPEDPPFIIRFLCKFEKLREVAESVAFIYSDNEKIELQVVAPKIDEAFAKQIDGVIIKNIDGSSKKIKCWVNTFEEIVDGIKQGDLHYIGLVNNALPIFEQKENLIYNLKERINQNEQTG